MVQAATVFQYDFPQRAAVAVLSLFNDLDLLLAGQRGSKLLRPCPEGLFLFRAVNSVQANLDGGCSVS